MNPWIGRFDPNISNARLIELTKVDAVPLCDLDKDPRDVAMRRIRDGLNKVFVPTQQVCDALRALIGIAYGHAIVRYPSQLEFVRGAYHSRSAPPPPICLSGFAGVGKTELLQALIRAFPPPSQVAIANHRVVPLISHWHITVKAADTLAILLRRLIDGDTRDLQTAAIQQLFLHGICVILLDELQFLSQSASANTAVAKLLMQISALGVPLVYCANFSLLHRLVRRPQEERQRLLVEPYVLSPEERGSKGWQLTLEEKFRVAPEFGQLNVENDGELIYNYTFGIKRLVSILLSLAYGIARDSNAELVGPIHIKQAYLSVQYTTCRADVESLFEQFITGTLTTDRQSTRADLFYPLTARTFPSNAANENKTNREQKAALASASAMLSSPAREVLSALYKGPAANDGKAAKSPRRAPATRSALLVGEKHFAASLNKTSK